VLTQGEEEKERERERNKLSPVFPSRAAWEPSIRRNYVIKEESKRRTRSVKDRKKRSKMNNTGETLREERDIEAT